MVRSAAVRYGRDRWGEVFDLPRSRRPSLAGDPRVMRRHSAVLLAFLLIVAQAANPISVRASDPIIGSIVTEHGRTLPPLPVGVVGESVQAEMLQSDGATPQSFAPGAVPAVPLSRPTSSSIRGESNLSHSPAALPNGLRKEILGFLPVLDADRFRPLVDELQPPLDGRLSQRWCRRERAPRESQRLGAVHWMGGMVEQQDDPGHRPGPRKGVRVVLTVTIDGLGQHQRGEHGGLPWGSSARAQLVSEIVAAVGARRADDIRLDFEPVASSLRDPVRSVREAAEEGPDRCRGRVVPPGVRDRRRCDLGDGLRRGGAQRPRAQRITCS